MKITIAGSELNNLLQTVSGALDAKPQVSILGGILIEASNGTVSALASNGAMTIKAEKPCEVNAEGSALIDGSMLCQFAAKLPEGIATLEAVEGKSATLKCRGSKTTLSQLNKDEFKKPEAITPKVKLRVDALKLRWAMKGVQYAIATTESRLTLTGMLLSAHDGLLIAVGLDGFRMAAYKGECEVDGEAELILSGRGAKEILKLASKTNNAVEIESDGSKVRAVIDGTEIISCLIAGEYINYKQIVPTNTTTTVRLNAKELKDAVERAMLVDDHNSLVRVDFGKEEVTVQSRGAVGETLETVACSMNGDEVNTAFNGKYLKECLSVVEDEEVEFRITSALQPVLVKAVDNDSYLHLVLPVRTQENAGA